MKIRFSLLFTSCLFCIFSFSQVKNERVQQIKKMYAEVNELLKNNNEETCTSAKEIVTDKFSPESEEIPFEQTYQTCRLAKGYDVALADLSGYEWGSSYTIYRFNSKIFFAFISSGAEACATETRVYFDTNENPIKVLEKTNNCDGNEVSLSTEIMDPKAINATIEDVTTVFKKVVAMTTK
jgi:hypothetical protein